MTTTSTPLDEGRAPERRSRILGPMRSRDFRLLWCGLLISNLGTWMQFTALGYLVVELAPTPRLGSLYIGLLGASRAVPVLLLSPVAGVVADRFPRRAVLVATNTITSVLALILAIVTASGHATIAILFVLSALFAGTQSFDAPARQSWVPLLVPREYVGNAIGLNSIAFNAPSVIGPPIAGFLIAASGVAPSFYVNAVSTLAVVIALFFMKPSPASEREREPFLRSVSAGVTMLYRHPVLRYVVLLLIVTSLLVRPTGFLLPAYAAHQLHVDARGLGWLMAATGIGAIIGAVATAAFTGLRRSGLWFASGAVMSASVAALGTTTAFVPALCILVVVGTSTLSFIGSSNILIQTLSPDEMRGRAVSVYSMILLGFVPLGSLVLGSVASLVGLNRAFLAGGICSLAVALWTYAAHAKLREA